MLTNTSWQSLAHILFVIIGLGWLLFIGADLVVPLIFGGLIALTLYPLARRFSKVVKFKSISILLSFLTVLIPMSLIAYLFSIQMASIIESLPEINGKISKGFDTLIASIGEYLPFLNINKKDLLEQQEGIGMLQKPLMIVGQGVISSSSAAISIALALIYSFLILYYRHSIKNFIIFQFAQGTRSNIRETFTKIKSMVQSYIGGLVIVIIVLSALNCLGLWLIGIKYPLFWGTLAGLLAIIPYVGTIIGGLLPFLFALATADHNYQPFAVIIYYAFIQFFEGNILTPKIVGDKVDVNPLFSILAVVFFGSFWGIGGAVLALPIISITRIILSQFEQTVPLAILMSSELDQKRGIFKKWADN